MNYQINQDDLNKLVNKLVVDGEYVHYSIPLPPAPRGCSTGALIRHIWKLCEFVHFVVHALPEHTHRPLDITVIPEKFDPNELIEAKYLGIITKYRPKNFLTDLEVQYARRDKIAFDEYASHMFYGGLVDFFNDDENKEDAKECTTIKKSY